MHHWANWTGNVAGCGRSFARLRIVLYGTNHVLPRQRRSLPRVCAQRAMLVLSWYGTPRASRSISTRPDFVKWKIYSWQSFRNRFELIGLKWPCDWRPPSRSPIVIDLTQWIVFCKTNKSRSPIAISCGSIGLDGAEPMLRKNEPLCFRIRWTCEAHSPHQRKYDCRSCRSEYLP